MRTVERYHSRNKGQRSTREISPCILSMLLLSLGVLTTPTQAGLTIGSVSSTSTCYDALTSSSGDDNLVDKEEYVTFVNILSDDFFTFPQFNPETNEYENLPVSEFYQLPIELQMNFNKLSCGGDFTICQEAYLITDGAGKGEDPTDQQTIYLYEVCSNTEKTIDVAKKNAEEREELTVSPITSSPVGSPSTSPSGVPTTTTIDLSKAVMYYTTFQYQILVDKGITAEAAMNPMHQMNMDLVTGMNEWSLATCEGWNNETRSERRLRGRNRGLFVTTEPETSDITNVTDVVCNNSTTSTNASQTRELQWVTERGDHCLQITQGQTYYLLLETYPENVTNYVSAQFDKDVASGSYLNTIPEPSRSEIRVIYPSSDEKDSVPPTAATKPIPAPTPSTGESIIGAPDDTEGSNTAAVAAGVSIALVVAIAGLFVARRRMIAAEAELKDDELDDVEGGNKRDGDWSDDDSSSSGSSRSSSSSGSSSSGSESSQSTSGSSNSYYSNSASTSAGGTSITGGDNGPISVSASDTDSYASHPREKSHKVGVAAAKTSVDVLNSNQVHDSMDSGSSVGEASLVEEAALEEIDSDSDHDSHSNDDRNEYEMNVDLTDADGLEISPMGRRSKESSYADDSSAGSSGWNSSAGDSSSTNTESVESFDANLVDAGSSMSKTMTTNTDEMDEYAVDRELLPGTLNPAVNPVVQPGVSMLPVDDEEDNDSAFLSDDSESSISLTKRSDAPPMGYEIQSAIEQGDWAAVGATAAILAPNPEEDSVANTTHTSEMDALVNSGNWSGIVAVAARYADDASVQSGPPPSDHGSVASHRRADSISSASLETADESSAMTQSQSSAGRMSQVSNATDSMSAASASSASYTGDSYTNTSYSGTGTSYSGTYSGTGTFVTGTSASEYTSEVSREHTHPSEDRDSSLTSSRSPPGSTSFAAQIASTSSDNPNDKQRINAFRAEVEALVRRVVPDEIDNVDAIMVQFNGREEELIATLRGMQEKTIAQRAKAAVQRSAKKEAVKTGGRIPDDYTASSEDQSSVRDSTYTDSAASIGDHKSMASTVDGPSVTGEFADDSSHSGSESGSASEYTSGSAYGTEEGSRSEYSRSEYSSEFTSRSGSGSSEYSSSQVSRSESRSYISGSVISEDTSEKAPDGLDGLMDKGDWSGIVDHARNMRDGGGRERDLD